MNKLLWILPVALLSFGCISSEEPAKPQMEETEVATVTSTELLNFVGSTNSLYVEIYNGLSEEEIVRHSVEVKEKLKISFTTIWRDGTWQIYLPSEDREENWYIQYNLAISNGRVIGAVAEVNPNSLNR